MEAFLIYKMLGLICVLKNVQNCNNNAITSLANKSQVSNRIFPALSTNLKML